MARVRYVGDEPRQVSILPAGGLQLVEPDELLPPIPDEHVESYRCQPELYEVDQVDEHQVDQVDQGEGEAL